jgi:hypothetical protein
VTTSADDEVVAGYGLRRDRHKESSELAAAASRRLGWARLGVFVATPTAAYLLSRRGPAGSATLAVAALVVAGLVAFFILVTRHRRYQAAERRERALAVECTHGIARVRRDWSQLPPPAASSDVTGHAFADDLNVFGSASLSRLVGPTGAITGERVIREWLVAEVPPPLDELRERQAAVAELAPLAEWRELFAVLGKAAGTSPQALDRFLAWAEESHDAIPGAVYWIARVLALIAIVIAVRVPFDPASWPWLLLMAVINLTFARAWRARISRELSAISSRGFDWASVSRMLSHVRAVDFTAPELRELCRRAEPERAGALRVLDAIGSCAEVRYSPMGHAALQILTLWDFHVVAALDKWRRAHGARMRGRMRALGEIEAFASLGALAFENPTWTYPRFLSDSTTIDASALAHPLLPAATRVGNDVTVGPRGTFVLVTGSNMAGKSTLLRTVGLNVVLAQLGAPVCATSFSLPRVRVRTVMHVRDSIASGTSLFLAELLRIRDVVTAARDTADAPLLYLADEILHGTNADDRRIAICAILADLLESWAIGMMATHLVGLETEPSLAAHVRPVHFTEHYDQSAAGLVMRFDYRLRPGPATTRNALRLLESIGVRTSIDPDAFK